MHQPIRYKTFTFFDIGENQSYFDHPLNEKVLNKVAEQCYEPAIQHIMKLLKRFPNEFFVSFSISGSLLEQCRIFRPGLIPRLQELVAHPNVEILGETYYHSLSYFYNCDAFKKEVKKHREAMILHFGKRPCIFKNTELAYDNWLNPVLSKLGFKGVITEGADRIMQNRPVNQLYGDVHDTRVKILLRNRSLSNDIGYRFSDYRWSHFPLQPHKFIGWMKNSGGSILNLCMDFEVLGERYSRDSGIFEFFENVASDIIRSPGMHFSLPSVAANEIEIFDVLDVYEPVTWTDKDNDLSVFRGNAMQAEALSKIYELGKDIVMTKSRKLIQTWLSLLASDHFYYMSTKGDGQMRNYFSPYRSPYDAYVYYMNILNDLELKVRHDDYFLSMINGIKAP